MSTSANSEDLDEMHKASFHQGLPRSHCLLLGHALCKYFPFMYEPCKMKLTCRPPDKKV